MVSSTKTNAIFEFRLKVLGGVFLLGFLIVIVRLIGLQVVSGSYWRHVANGQHGGEITLLPTRGEIQAQDKKNGQTVTVATTTKKHLVFAVPPLVNDATQTTAELEKIIGVEKSVLEERLKDKSKRYVVLKRNLTEDEVARIKQVNLAGIRLEDEPARFYPHGDILGPVLGFVGFNDASKERVGLYGIEKSLEEELRGSAGKLVQERASRTSAWIFGGQREFQEPKDGDAVLLTIDLPTQRKAEELMKATLEKHGAEHGCAIVMDPSSGSILAMVSVPGFDPNNYSQVENPAVYNNQCTTPYEPGSVFKPLTVAFGLEEGKLTPDTTYVDTGQVKLDGFTIKNSDGKAHGKQTMTQVLEESLNTGAIFAKDAIGNASFTKWVKKMGFGSKTGVEVQESIGNLKNLDKGASVNFATASFGQGITVTPLQMANSFAVVANGGKKVTPHIVQSIVKSTGDREDTVSTAQEQIFKASTVAELTGMMVSVVENGHGKRAKVKGYSVAGKTGTAQVALPGESGYDEHRTIGTFVGFAPAYNPKFVILTRVDAPKTVQFAESTAAPVFGELLRFVLDRFNIPPDRVEAVKSQ